MVVMFKVEKHSLVIQHFPDGRQIENGLAFLQNMNSGDYLPNSETWCLWENLLSTVAGKLLIEKVHDGFVPQNFTFNWVSMGYC